MLGTETQGMAGVSLWTMRDEERTEKQEPWKERGCRRQGATEGKVLWDQTNCQGLAVITGWC